MLGSNKEFSHKPKLRPAYKLFAVPLDVLYIFLGTVFALELTQFFALVKNVRKSVLVPDSAQSQHFCD